MTSKIAIREGFKPGDFGAIVEMHGRLYAAEYNLDATFEIYVAEPMVAFSRDIMARGDVAGALWVVERDHTVVGSAALVDGGADVDLVRWVVLEPTARGMGVARQLMDRLVERFQSRGKRHLRLGTFHKLDAAIRLYERHGFREISRAPQRIWGQDLELIEMQRDA